jgi:hypothetical protein
MPQEPFYTGKPRNPLLGQAFAGLDSTANRTRNLENADARQNFDPSFDLRNPYYQELYRQNGDPFAETGGQKDQRKLVSGIQQQQAEDFDLEYNQPRRAELGGDIKRDEAMRDAQAKSDIYFDPDVARQRGSENEQQLTEFQRRYVDPKVAEAEGRARAAELARDAAIQAAEYKKQGVLGAAKLGADARVTQGAMKGFTDVGIQRGMMDPSTFNATQGELQRRMPGVDEGKQAEDVAAAADAIVRAYPGRNAQQLRALIPQMFDQGQIGEAEMWMLEQEIRRRTGDIAPYATDDHLGPGGR